jgi:hypothetical protein
MVNAASTTFREDCFAPAVRWPCAMGPAHLLELPDVRPARASTRRKLFQPVEVHTTAGRLRGHLLDLSERGAMLHVPGLPPAARTVTVHSGAVQRVARVAWLDGQRCGVAFARPLSAAELEALVAVGTAGRRQGT